MLISKIMKQRIAPNYSSSKGPSGTLLKKGVNNLNEIVNPLTGNVIRLPKIRDPFRNMPKNLKPSELPKNVVWKFDKRLAKHRSKHRLGGAVLISHTKTNRKSSQDDLIIRRIISVYLAGELGSRPLTWTTLQRCLYYDKHAVQAAVKKASQQLKDYGVQVDFNK